MPIHLAVFWGIVLSVITLMIFLALIEPHE